MEALILPLASNTKHKAFALSYRYLRRGLGLSNFYRFFSDSCNSFVYVVLNTLAQSFSATIMGNQIIVKK